MDELDPSVGETAVSPAKKPRKPAAKRGRPAANAQSPQTDNPASDLAASDGPVDSANATKRLRTKRGKTSVGDGDEGRGGAASAPELFSDFGGAAREAEAAEPFKASFSPDDYAPAREYGVASGVSEPSAGSGSEQTLTTSVPSAAPENAGEIGAEERPVFVPQTSGAAGAPSSPQGVGGGAGGGDQGNAASREDRKTWWERKKEKKRLKWMERQQGGGGHPSGPSGGQQGGPSGSSGGYFGALSGGAGAGEVDRGGGFVRGRDRDRDRDRPMSQPPPPALHGPVGGLPDASRFAEFSALDGMADELAKDEGALDLAMIHASPAGELAQRLRELGENVVGMPPRRALVDQLFAWAAREKRGFIEKGQIDLTDAGHGFIVHICNSYRLSLESTYIPPALVKRHGLRRGQEIEVLVQPPKTGERCPVAVRLMSVMGTTPELAREVTAFEELIPYYPTSRILVEAPIHKDISMRAVDLLTPIGFGQRGLIVAPPRTGKTVLLQNIANSISHNFPEVTLILLLIDERPEEVTDFKRHTKGEVVSSTFDETPESHVHAAEMVIERARRLVELGKHVVILLDSVTRLARAYNALAGNSGKIMSGGIEANALQRPKRFFGSARNIEGGGSLTILGTALVDTNSRMDEVIFEEFKGTGNMELHLDRGLSDKRIFPAINIDRSGTRKEELIYHPDEMLRVYGLRRAMQGIPPVEAMDMFIQRLKKTRTNTEFLLSLNR